MALMPSSSHMLSLRQRRAQALGLASQARPMRLRPSGRKRVRVRQHSAGRSPTRRGIRCRCRCGHMLVGRRTVVDQQVDAEYGRIAAVQRTADPIGQGASSASRGAAGRSARKGARGRGRRSAHDWGAAGRYPAARRNARPHGSPGPAAGRRQWRRTRSSCAGAHRRGSIRRRRSPWASRRVSASKRSSRSINSRRVGSSAAAV